MKRNKDKISIVIPCYKSEKTIQKVVDSLVKNLKKRGNEFEIVLVNDCSPDDVWSVIKSLVLKYGHIVKGINLSKNFGQQAALMAGYSETHGDIIVSLDDDGQTDPNDIWLLIDELNNGYDVVMAKYPQLKEKFYRRLGSLINNKMAEVLLKKPKNLVATSYIAYKRYVIDEMLEYDKPFTYISGLIYRITNNIGQVEIEHHDRISGNSGYNLKKLVGLLINGFTAFSIEPLRIGTYIGFTVSGIGFIYGIVIIIRKLTSSIQQPGYSSIMACLLFVGGIIMVLLGLIGEYIGRIYICINKSPQYVVKEKTNIKQNINSK